MRSWTGTRIGPGIIARAVLRLTVIGLLQSLPPTTVRAQSGTLLVDETFSGASVPDPNFSAHGLTCLTGRPVGSTPAPGTASIPACPRKQEGPVPPPGVTPGYLQFTEADNNEAGNVLYNRPIPSNAGLIATFDQFQYGGNGADGISFFLVDGATQLTQTGGTGGSLAYAQHNTEPGIPGGYLGVGFDVFGNFYNDLERRGTGCPAQQRPPFPAALVPGTIVLRGPGNLTNGFCYLGSTTAGNPPVTTLPGTLRGATLATSARRAQVTITPAPTPRVIVTVDFNNGAGPQTVLDVAAPANPPVTYKFGWAGSTGGSDDVHLLRNVVVKTVTPLTRLDLVKQINRTQPLPDPLVVGSVVPYQFILTNSGLEVLTALQVQDSLVPNVTCPATQIAPAPAPGSTVVCTGSHVITQADLDAGQLVNTATATALNSASQPVTSNSSSVTLALGTTAKLTLKKFVDTPPPYAIGSSVTYRYDVTNTGNVTLSAPSVTDDKVAAITCDPPTVLTPGSGFGSSTTCHGTYVIRAPDIDAAGFVTNTASASAQPPTGARVTSAPASLRLAVGTDIAVTKIVDHPTPLLGEIVTFTVTAANQGPADATGLALSDLIGAGIAFVGASPAAGTSYDAATGAWTIGSLAVGASVTLELFAQVTTVHSYTNTASIAALTEPDINPGNNTAQAVITPISNADIAMAKSISTSTPAVGEQVTFTVTATNLGPSPATGVRVSDPLPFGLSFVAAAPSQGTYVPGTGAWTVGALAPTEAATLALTARVTQSGAFTNTATKTAGDQPDPTPGNDTASVSGTAARVADLSITKTDGVTSVVAGQPDTYTITVVNAGPSDVVGATVADVFPGTLTGVTWTCIPDARSACGAPSGAGPIATTVTLPAGGSATFRATGTVAPTATDTLSNTATVTVPAGTTDPTPGNNSATDTTTLATSADLVASKSAPPGLVVPGNNVTFTVGVINQGPSTASAVMLTDQTPEGLTFVSTSGDCATQFPCDLGTLAPGASRTITATYAIPAGYTTPDPITNTVTATSTTPDPAPDNNAATAQVSVNAPRIELVVTKSNGVASVVAGTTTRYTITVQNQGPSAGTGVHVTDVVPAVLTGVTWTCSASEGSCPASGSGSIDTLVTLPVNATATFLLTGTVAPDATGAVSNTVNAVPPPGTSDPTGDATTDTDQITTQADVVITKTGPASVVPGTHITYTLVVTNDGPSTAVDVVVADPTPPGTTFVSNSGGCTTAFPCALGSLAPGATRTITTTLAVPAGYTAPDPIVDRASVASPTPDPTPGNNTASATTSVNTNVDIAMAKRVTPETARVGDTVTFVVQATNQGPGASTGIIVTDLLPAGLALTDAAPAQGTYDAASGQWVVGGLATGATAELTLTALVTQPGTITNLATNTFANEPDPDTSNDAAAATLNAAAEADVGLQKTVDNAAPALHAPVTFVVTATNRGPSAATAIVVHDLVPAGLGFVAATPSQGTYDPASGTWSVGDLTVGAAATLTLAATVEAAGPLVNEARTTAQGEPDPNPANNVASVTLNGAGTADVAVAKAISTTAPPLGGTVTFTVTAKNLGPSGATGVVVNDPLPSGLSLVSATPSQGSYVAGTGDWTVGALTPTQSAVLSITALVTQAGPFTNTATKTHAVELDPNPANDRGSVTGTPQAVADLSVTKTDGLTTASAGQAVTYTVTVRNAGPSPVVGATVSDAFPAVLRGVTWTCLADPGSVCQSHNGAGDLAALVDLPAEGSAIFTATGTLAPDAKGTLVNTARVEPPAGTLDPDPGNDEATDTTDLSLSANLVVLKTGPVRVVPGTRVVYAIVVGNQGPATASAVTAEDPVPPGLVFVANAGDCTTPFPCALGALPPGASRIITATYRVLPDAASLGTIVNTVTVSSPLADPVLGSNSSRVTAVVVVGADLTVSKTAPASAEVGSALVYGIRITNNGPSSATDVVLTDPIPSGLDVLSATVTQGTCAGTTTVSCAVGRMAAGTSVTATITVRPRAAAVGSVTNTVTVASSAVDPVPANNTASARTAIAFSANLALAKTVAPEAIAVGEPLTYTLRVTNQGPGPATGVTLADPLPAAVVPGPATATQGTCTLADHLLTCLLGDLAVNATATVTIPATRAAVEAFANTATVMASEPDPDPGNNQATALTAAAGDTICGNCSDDDGDGLVDYADPDCCTQMGTLTVTRVRVSPRGAQAKLRVTGTLTGAGFNGIDPRREDVSLRLADVASAPACCTIAQDHWLRLFGQQFGFWDRPARICPPISDVRLRGKQSGARFSIASRLFDPTQLDQSPLTLTIRVGGSCATGTAPLRRTKSGGAVFP